MNQTFVEFAVRDYNKPMGVATYRASEEMPERLRKALPDIDELKKYCDEMSELNADIVVLAGDIFDENDIQ